MLCCLCLRCRRASASSSRLLDDILRWGSQAIFAGKSAEPGQPPKPAAAAAKDDGQGPVPMEASPSGPGAQVGGCTDAGETGHSAAGYPEQVLDLLVQHTMPAALRQRQAEQDDQAPLVTLGPGLDMLPLSPWVQEDEDIPA